MADDEIRAAASAWLAEAKKLEKKWPINAPSVLEMTKKPQNRNHYHIQSSINIQIYDP